MYNETSLVASFDAMREHQPHLIPVTRLIYGQPAPIWLERTSGPLRAASVYVDEETADSQLPGLLDAGHMLHGDASEVRTGPGFLRACKGGHQGCPLATNQCILPYFIALSHVQRLYPQARIAGFADDTYLNASPAVLYNAYAAKRRLCRGPAEPGEPTPCELDSNLTKVAAWSPSGSISEIPDGVGDGIKWSNGFKCVGVCKGPDETVRAATTARLLKGLAPLDNIDKLQDTEQYDNVAQHKKMLLTDCAAQQGVYWAQAQRPDLCGPGLAAARDRLRVSWEALTGADASPRERADLAWAQALNPTNMGGCGVYDAYALREAIYAASVTKNWKLLQRISPELNCTDFATTELPSIAAARAAYEKVRAERDRVAAVHAAYDAFEYHILNGEKLPRFRPHSLTPAKRMPAPTQLFVPDENGSIQSPPSQKALSSVTNHSKWLSLIDGAHEFDAVATDTKINHREATRVISASQFGAGMWLEAAPDASLPHSKLKSGPYVIALQRRLGLYLSSAKAANDELLHYDGISLIYL